MVQCTQGSAFCTLELVFPYTQGGTSMYSHIIFILHFLGRGESKDTSARVPGKAFELYIPDPAERIPEKVSEGRTIRR